LENANVAGFLKGSEVEIFAEFEKIAVAETLRRVPGSFVPDDFSVKPGDLELT